MHFQVLFTKATNMTHQAMKRKYFVITRSPCKEHQVFVVKKVRTVKVVGVREQQVQPANTVKPAKQVSEKANFRTSLLSL